MEGFKQILNAVKGISQSQIEKDLKKMKDEIKSSCREILGYCQEL